MKKETLTNETINKIVNDGSLSKSKKFIKLYDLGLEIKEISVIFGVKYNFVYNVISNYCRMNELELRTNNLKENSKKQLIIDLFNAGRSNVEIAKELKTNYNYVYKIVKEQLNNM